MSCRSRQIVRTILVLAGLMLGQPTRSLAAPEFLFSDQFTTPAISPASWTIAGQPTVDEVGIGEPSPPYALRLNGLRAAGESVESRIIDLSGRCGVTLSYFYQRAGGGSSPESGDDIILEFVNDASVWTELDRQLGSGPDMTVFEARRLALPASAYHAAFRFRLRCSPSVGSADDWFVDDVAVTAPDSADCNSNGTPDECDVLSGASTDCNNDDVLDECQQIQDCDSNGVSDECQLVPVWGTVLDFDGVNDYVGITSNATLRPPNNFTIEAWVKMNSFGTGRWIVGHDENGSAEDGYTLAVVSSGRAAFAARNSNGMPAQNVESDGTLQLNQWHHIAGVYDNSVLRVYLDGAETSKAASGNVAYSVLNSVNIGRRGGTALPGTSLMEGSISDVRLWNVVRTGDQIRNHRHVRLSGAEPGLVAYWRLDEPQGATAFDSAGTHDGTLTNGPTWRTESGDCNTNGVPDFCDISGGTSADLVGPGAQADGMPDECQVDCNDNWIPDALDITSGQSGDCNDNGIPDECDVAAGIGYDCDSNGVLDHCSLGPIPGHVADFDGVDDYVRVPSAAALRPANNFTIEAWIKLESLGAGHWIVGHDENGSARDGYTLAIVSSGRAAFAARNSNGMPAQNVESTGTVQLDTWHHVVGVYDNSVLRVYLDGEMTSKIASGNVAYAVLANVDIGRRGGAALPGTSLVHGSISEVRFWNVVRTPDQIGSHRYVRRNSSAIRNGI